jgi:SecD/SecF fusion protein
MRHLYRHVTIVVATLLLSVWLILPLDKSIRFGKDLAGGATLVYQVVVESGDAKQVVSRLIEVLKQRVDPTGVKDISFVPLDNNRIEITMPLPDAQVKVYRATFDEALRKLTTGAIDARTLDQKMSLPAEQRDGALRQIVGEGNAARLGIFGEAAAAFDASREASKAFAAAEVAQQGAINATKLAATEAERRLREASSTLDTLRRAAASAKGTPQEAEAALKVTVAESTLKELTDALTAARAASDAALAALDEEAAKVLAANKAYAKARDRALATAISRSSLERVLGRNAVGKLITLRDEEAVNTVRENWARITFESASRPREDQVVLGKQARLPSPRDIAIQRLLREHPEASTQIIAAVAAWDALQKNSRTLDDPNDLKRILRGAGILEFRIAAGADRADIPELLRQLTTEGPSRGLDGKGLGWFRINKEESWYDDPRQYDDMIRDPTAYFRTRNGLVAGMYDGEIYILLQDVAFGPDGARKRLTRTEGDWAVAGANPTADEFGRPAIAFRMDVVGARLMSELTGGNIQKHMAVVLDGQVYTAPTIQGQIGAQGQISGAFSQAEIDYVVRVLAAGALSGKLSPDPISESSIGPELGRDNLVRGLTATAIAFVLVSGFMVIYYFAGGVISVIALGFNLLLIMALMSLNGASFTLPGIAGIILTFGMAVDANVLIFERLREETVRGNDLKTGVRLAYSKALTAIVDGNVTNLIVCVVLGFYGTPEIKGFAITMSIGVITTLFCQLYITRIIYVLLVDKLHVKWLGHMLPLAVPALQRAITPHIDWMRYRGVFIAFSLVLTGVCLAVIFGRGPNVLDTEFRGGTRITVQLKSGQTMTRGEIEETVKEIGPANAGRELGDLEKAEVLALNPASDGVTAARFVVKTTVQNGTAVGDAIFASPRLAEKIDALRKLSFDGFNSSVAERSTLPVLPITAPLLRDNFKSPEELALLEKIGEAARDKNVSDFSGGALIVMNSISPPEPLTQLQARFDRVRTGLATDRRHQLVITSGNEAGVTGAVALVRDDKADALTNRAEWERVMKAPTQTSERALSLGALKLSQSQAGVESFSASIASTFLNQAIISIVLSTLLIVIYVWVRFNSFRYSLAAILTTLHDCIVAVGAIAAAELVFDAFPNFSASIGLLPFKIDLNVVAAVLTILGYSLNDTIVVMDRIRENRGKLPYATREVINNSINQTFSRTLMTGGSVIIATIVLYFVGGEAVRAFAFCFLVGVLTGTYSSVAVAAPTVWVRKSDPSGGARRGGAAHASNGTITNVPAANPAGA